ncbi:WD40 repeat-like protein [Dendrothele bispora CBS 962.96]|uniref:Protein HIR n=1 Tax=Dendrothele bispora (strain CBS 962.96) TaxID=1314807 RepID=A0A4S8MLC7_DENBC|nr:WD40 repeat-like protein [Dendrothele bispora CBS 962.96]
MHFTKPAWVVHNDSSTKSDATKRLSIFSIHVHPDGSRIATGGLDAKVRIWSTKPILNAASEASNKPPKALCTLTMHTGPVLTVRWAHSGRWLASGSDDEIVMIWDLDPHSRGKVWGSDEVNVEGWKPMKRLPGHESDVTDVAWAPGDRYLASVGLDSNIIIWCGYTLERLTKIDQHQGFVKGVCWDPVGEFLATQSDDRSVKIWRTTDWGLEAEVKKPFEDSPGSTFFRRLSWSPDGAHITASNATNNKGFVFIAAVITRGSWTSEISLVGHENTVEVAAYNPHIFLRDPASPVATSNICSVVALGADDRSVSVWQTKSARPLIVAKEVFERQIMDLSWSWDGMTLYAASSDGTIAVFNFEPEEMDGIAPHSVQEQYLSKFNFVPPKLPDSYSHIVTPATTQTQPQPQPQSNSFGNQVNGNGGEQVNVLVAKKNTKKRANLTSMSSVPSAGAPLSSAGAKRASFMSGSGQDTKNQQRSSFFPGPDEQPFGDVDMIPIDSFDSGRSRGRAMEEDIKPTYRTLGGDRPRQTVPIRELPSSGVAIQGGYSGGINLAIPALMTKISVQVEGTSGNLLEVINAEDGGVTEVMYIGGDKTLWLDYLPAPVNHLQTTPSFCAVAMTDGSVNVYSHTGRRLMPTISLGSQCSTIDAKEDCLMVLTQTGMLYSWNVKNGTAFFPPVSIAPIMPISPNETITSAFVRPNGCPVLNASNGVAFAYDISLCSWVKVSERWWAEGSDVWPSRQRNGTNGKGVLPYIEGTIGSADESSANKQRPEWWNAAMTLGHLETRLHASRVLDSPTEFRQTLQLYARKIADEGFRAKAEELIKELCGPIYWHEGKDTNWSPTVAGSAKRELLKDVLSIFVKSKTLTKLGMDWQDLLKKVAAEE